VRRVLRQLRLFSVLFAASAAAGSFHAVAQPTAAHRVVLVSPGDPLERAARTALPPWAIEIVVVSAPSPGATAPLANEAARALALAQGAGAVVWVSQHAHGHAVWMYDLETDQVVSRALPGTLPFDGAAAAAAALSIKTLLRHSATAPKAERFGAETAEPLHQPPAAAEVSAPRGADPDEVADEDYDDGERSEYEDLPSLHAATTRSWFDIEAALSVRFGLARSHAQGEPRFAAGAVFWPDAGWLGLSIRGGIGTGVPIDESRLHGRLLDVTVVAAGRVRYSPIRSLQLSAAAGPGLHVTPLYGEIRPTGEDVNALRVVPSADLELGADWLVSTGFRVGLAGGLSWLLRPQRYLVRAEPVLELSRTAFDVRLGAAVTLPE
jgi:hypothetical protein